MLPQANSARCGASNHADCVSRVNIHYFTIGAGCRQYNSRLIAKFIAGECTVFGSSLPPWNMVR